jgi:hypothetical protein
MPKGDPTWTRNFKCVPCGEMSRKIEELGLSRFFEKAAGCR